MISGRHHRKLIDGLVVAIGRGAGGGKPGASGSDEPEEPIDDEGPPAAFGDKAEGSRDEEAGEDSATEDEEAEKCAEDAFRAFDRKDTKGFVEAIRTIAGGYGK